MQILETEYGSRSLSQIEVAGRLGLNSAYFSRLFKKEQGKTFMTALTEIRMGHAAELLQSGISPQDTAILCGYASSKYFYESFTAQQGITPARYQQELTAGRTLPAGNR